MVNWERVAFVWPISLEEQSKVTDMQLRIREQSSLIWI